MSWSKVLPELALLVAFIFAWRLGSRTFKVHPWGVDEKADASAVGRAVLYVFVASIVLWIGPPLGIIGGTLAFIFAIVLAVSTVVTLVELPQSLDPVYNLASRDGWQTPVYSRTKQPVPYVRWARRFAFLALLLLVAIAAIIGGITGPDQPAVSANGGNTVIADPTVQPTTTQPTAPATAAPQVTDTTTAPTTDDSSAPAQQYVDNDCSGPKQIEVAPPKDIPFGTGNLKVCYNGQWQEWSAFATTKPPKTVQLTAWTVEGVFGYGQVVDKATGNAYIIRTTDFK